MVEQGLARAPTRDCPQIGRFEVRQQRASTLYARHTKLIENMRSDADYYVLLCTRHAFTIRLGRPPNASPAATEHGLFTLDCFRKNPQNRYPSPGIAMHKYQRQPLRRLLPATP